jgi:pyridoxine 5-phosphate synthase
MAQAKAVGADRVELYTEPYAASWATPSQTAQLDRFVNAARTALAVGLGVNAGHDLNLENLAYFAACIPGLLEVSIGHALISDALTYGMENTVRMYQRCLEIKS